MNRNINSLLPQGVKNFVPGEAGGFKNIEAEILDEFSKWGYKRVITPLFENLETINAGLNERLRSQVMKFVDPSTGDVVALRPDITPQIGRIVATRMSHLKEPQRLCYSGRVVRFEHESSGREREVFQAGCELVGKKDLSADAEIMAIAASALARVGFSSGLVLDIGHSGVLRAVDGIAGKHAARVRAALEMKSSRDLDAALSSARLSGAARSAITALTQTRNVKKVLSVMDKLPAFKTAAANIRGITNVLDEYETGCDICLDVCDVRSLNYYTGVTFQILHERAPSPLIAGGRYDSLIKRYGHNTPATGFAADIEAIVKALSGVRKAAETVHFVIIPAKPSLRREAIRLGAWLRANGFQVIAESRPRPARGTAPSSGIITIDGPDKLRLTEPKTGRTRRFSNLEELISEGV
ncbi:MAG: ATP phosphoribosyltransferase regulatory subunit [Candidatus Dadabacteria bacterium]|nr:ATP phosphoribosyltransferase regulatory subunit [Candidatus Dadabacteria bacterium]